MQKLSWLFQTREYESRQKDVQENLLKIICDPFHYRAIERAWTLLCIRAVEDIHEVVNLLQYSMPSLSALPLLCNTSPLSPHSHPYHPSL
jgi:hypothetical protein